jgi:putative membrane protein
MKQLLQNLTLLILGVYIIYLYSINRLNFLIHERYLLLTLVAGVTIAVIALVGLFQFIKDKNRLKSKLELVPLFVAILAITVSFIPLRSLSSESFNLRSITTIFKVSESEKSDITQKIKFNIDSNQFSMYDWIRARSIDDQELFRDKEFTGIGFVSPKDDKMFTISRFIVSCCVVDATPAGLLVEYNYKPELKENDWVEVKGKFKIEKINDTYQPVIVPTSVLKVKQPDNVYLNR